ncbi:MAG: carboxypeptidase regulatory-like domain-containing protein [Acidobacteria bacterium]|nr:carboxypeptidase regulatory-like domain-containing protein [Acidobacteriota bacterium]
MVDRALPIALAFCLLVSEGAEAQGSLASISGSLLAQQGDQRLPLAGCTVSASSPENGPLVGEFSDDEGRFVLAFPPAARVRAVAQCPGHRMVSVDGRRGPPLTYDCSAPGPCAEVEIILEQLGVAEGFVVDENGRPVEGVQLLGGLRLGSRTRDGIRAISDDRGYFRFSNLSPGKYEVVPSLNEPLAPGVNWKADAFEFQIAPGDNVSGLQVRMRLEAGVDFSGRIEGLPPGTKRAMITLSSIDPMLRNAHSQQVELDEQGRFELPGVPTGAYDFSVLNLETVDDTAPKVQVSLGTVRVGEQDNPVLSLRAPVVVKGRLQLIAPEREGIRAPRPGDPVFLMLQREDGSRSIIQARPPDYQLAGRDFRPGRYEVRAPGPGGRIERRVGDNWQAFRSIELLEGQTVELDLRVSFEVGSLSVLVKPPAGSQETEAAHYVVGIRRDGFTMLQPTDQHGRLILDAFPAGEYEICAWPDIDYTEANDPETWRKAGEAVRRFRHEEGVDMEIELTAAAP